MEPRDIVDWAPEGTRKIAVSQVFLNAPFELIVRRFIPREGDRLDKIWYENGEMRRFPVPPYAILNMEEAARSIDEMIKKSQHIYLHTLLKPFSADHGGDFLWETYLFAFHHPRHVKVCYFPNIYPFRIIAGYTDAVGNQDETTRSLIWDSFRFWVACRLTSYPDAIVSKDTLGLTEKIKNYASGGWVEHFPTPPVMGAQLECIVYSKYLRPLSDRIRASLDELLKKRTHGIWLTVYLTLFVLLHSCAMLTRRDSEYARQMNLETKYANPGAIRAHQKGAITLLAHYHTVLGGPRPLGLAASGGLKSVRNAWNFSEEQEAFMRETYLRTSVMGESLQFSREYGTIGSAVL